MKYVICRRLKTHIYNYRCTLKLLSQCTSYSLHLNKSVCTFIKYKESFHFQICIPIKFRPLWNDCEWMIHPYPDTTIVKAWILYFWWIIHTYKNTSIITTLNSILLITHNFTYFDVKFRIILKLSKILQKLVDQTWISHLII